MPLISGRSSQSRILRLASVRNWMNTMLTKGAAPRPSPISYRAMAASTSAVTTSTGVREGIWRRPEWRPVLVGGTLLFVTAPSFLPGSAFHSKPSRSAVFQQFWSPLVDSPQHTVLVLGTLMMVIIGGVQVRDLGVNSLDRESSHFGRLKACISAGHDLEPANGKETVRSLVKGRRRNWHAAHETNSDAAPYMKSRHGGSEQSCRLPPRFVDADRSLARSGNAIRGGLLQSR